MRCTFCATGKGGFARNLMPHEIIDQVLLAATAATSSGDPGHMTFCVLASIAAGPAYPGAFWNAREQYRCCPYTFKSDLTSTSEKYLRLDNLP